MERENKCRRCRRRRRCCSMGRVAKIEEMKRAHPHIYTYECVHVCVRIIL